MNIERIVAYACGTAIAIMILIEDGSVGIAVASGIAGAIVGARIGQSRTG